MPTNHPLQPSSFLQSLPPQLVPSTVVSCTVCKNLEWPNGFERIEIPFESLELSALAQKCIVCKMLYDGAVLFHLDPGESVKSCVVGPAAEGGLGVDLWLSCSDRIVLSLLFYNAKGRSPPWADVAPRPSISGDTGSGTAISWVFQKATDCTKNHQICLQNIGAPLPTRIIDVGESNESNDDYLEQPVRLYETNGEREPYVCLSHCWGGFQPCETNTANLASRKDGIPFYALPRTFRDAVTFVRKLPRIRYLWIDSLCIIQDNKSDWRRESMNMWAIYQGSFLNLAASKAHDATEGCFSISSGNTRGYKIQGDWNSSKEWEVHVRQCISHPEFGGVGAIGALGAPSPLLQRAWVFQERILAPRVLHFTGEELLWECSEEIACECSDIGIQGRESLKFCYSKSILDGSPLVLISLWEKLVSDFTALGLTKTSDCFPAISGLAKQISSAGGLGKYYCGLWQGFFIRGMLWQREFRVEFSGEHSNMLRPEKWRAPSWSWASVDAPIKYLWTQPELQAECQVTEVNVQGICEEIFGELRSGWITVSGQMGQVSCYHDKPSWAKNLVDGTDQGSWGMFGLNRYYVSTECFDFIKVLPDYAWERGPKPISETEVLYCLKVASSSHDGTCVSGLADVGLVTVRVHHVYFLVLRKVDSWNTYERVGIMCVTPDLSKRITQGCRQSLKIV